MLGTFIIITFGICLGLTQVCRLSVIAFLGRNPHLLLLGQLGYFLTFGIYDKDDPAASDFLIIFFVLFFALPFMFYVDPIAAFTNNEKSTPSSTFMFDRFLYFIGAVFLGDGLAKPVHEFSIKFMSFLIPASKLDPHPMDREEMKPKYNQYESYEDFSERRRREDWKSSFFAENYANYEEYAAKHGGYKTKDKPKAKTRNYSKARTQSVPHTPKIGAMQVLGLTGDPTAAQVKSAYRKLARKHHPDRFMSQGPAAVATAEAKMKDINAAYDYMKNSSAS